MRTTTVGLRVVGALRCQCDCDYVVLSDAHVRGTLRVRRSEQSQVLAHFDIGDIRLMIHDHPSHVVGSRLAVNIVF